MASQQDRLTKLDILIKENEHKLGPREQKIASYFSLNQAKIAKLSVSQIANEIGLSQVAIVRFCKKLGFSGLKEFKIYYQTGYTHDERSKSITWDDSDEEVFNSVFSNGITTFEKTFVKLPYQRLSALADRITKAKTIDVYALGGSAIVASFFKQEFIRLGKRVELYTDGFSIKHVNYDISNADLVIIVSRSGCNEPLVNLFDKAREAKIETALITAAEESILAQRADHVIITEEVEFFKDDKNSYSRLAQLSMITCLYLMCVIRQGKDDDNFKQNYFKRTNFTH